MTTDLIIIDTEYEWNRDGNPHPARDGTFMEVIQIAALRLRRSDLSIQAAQSLLITPHFNPVLSPRFCELTGITQAQAITDGMSFADALAAFLEFCGDRPVYAYGHDAALIRENADAHSITLPQSWPHTEATDLHPWFSALDDRLGPINSGRLAATLGIPIDPHANGMHEHNALFDTYSIQAAARHLIATRSAVFPDL